jgi:hypothetical protein
LRELRKSQHADARGGEFDRERHPVNPGADVIDRGAPVPGGRKVTYAAAGSLDEQRGRVLRL